MTRAIEYVALINGGIPSSHLGISQLDSYNAGFRAELEEDKLRVKSCSKNYHDHVHNSIIHLQSKTDLNDTSKISVVNSSVPKKRKGHWVY